MIACVCNPAAPPLRYQMPGMNILYSTVTPIRSRQNNSLQTRHLRKRSSYLFRLRRHWGSKIFKDAAVQSRRLQSFTARQGQGLFGLIILAEE